MSSARYDSAAVHRHVDFAVRYSHSVGNLDLGLAHCRGTSREPRFERALTASGEPVLAPRYDQINQTSIDVLYAWESCLFKLEALHRTGQGRGFAAAVGGFEYTVVGVLGSGCDLGVLSEYHWDERDRRALTPFNRDLFAGLRLAVNDALAQIYRSGSIVESFQRWFGAIGNDRLLRTWHARDHLRVQ
jgi:hypothetical protein